MEIAVLYLSTALVFLVIDAVMLKTVLRPVFDGYIGDWLLNDIRMGAAVVFYLFYVAGLMWFVSIPSLRADAPLNALYGGALLGAIAYGTYEFTNYATLRNWSINMVALDFTWGIFLTAISAYLGVLITRAVI